MPEQVYFPPSGTSEKAAAHILASVRPVVSMAEKATVSKLYDLSVFLRSEYINQCPILRITKPYFLYTCQKIPSKSPQHFLFF